MATVKQTLDIARKDLGYTENPSGSNRTKYGKWIGLDGQAWCMSFCQYVCYLADVHLPVKTGSCGTLMNAAKQAGMWVTSNFRPGDIVIYDFSGKQKTTQHCGIVEAVLPDYGVQAIEGNTSVSGSQDNGGMVCRRTRKSKYIIGAVRPKYDAEIKQEDVSKMTIKEFIDKMTDEQAYTLLQKAQKHAATLPLPDWAYVEMQEAIKNGITDGTRPMELTPRYQAAIMTNRMVKIK